MGIFCFHTAHRKELHIWREKTGKTHDVRLELEISVSTHGFKAYIYTNDYRNQDVCGYIYMHQFPSCLLWELISSDSLAAMGITNCPDLGY